MIKKILVLVVLWIVFVFADYLYLPYFVKPLSWILVCVTLVILLVKQIIKVIKEGKNLQPYRLLNLFITAMLLFLTVYNFNKIPHSIIEKLDWSISYNKRQKIVKEVLAGKLKPNTEMNYGIYRLPFDFPVISNGGNDIWIDENKNNSMKTIKFWISRGFFDSPQTYFIFTNDTKSKKYYEEKIKTKPEYNWKIEENWYRIMERD
ncbi:hypothetical protein ASG01_07575 [Chryseobacterium sp. Leaf180]|uniref:hypothetical protein n=1 Tax=Chryseobacterium sp. Leaf180 TaxID=1736289 RepID=UPI0006F7EC39|nr:hypothetical protein [Chryseobacterium sp. Leaf180]KQR93718.1 hypothetical protein ASG01_07575 [Chryseobacterium sp. Leaf180]